MMRIILIILFIGFLGNVNGQKISDTLNKYIDKNIYKDYKTELQLELTDVVETKSTLKPTELVIKNSLYFYSNEYISFYYPNSWSLNEKELIKGIASQIYLEGQDIALTINVMELGDMEHDISLNQILNSTINGMKKNMKGAIFTTEKQMNFKDYDCLRVNYKYEILTMPFIGEIKVFKVKKQIITVTMINKGNIKSKVLKQIEKSLQFYGDTKQQIQSISTEINVGEIEKLAQEGDKYSQVYLSYAYFEGKDMLKNDKKAIFWTKVLANENYMASQYMLGVFYENGIGTNKDILEAKRWYEKSAKQDYVDAQLRLYKLSKKYHDYDKALEWLMIATNNKNNANALFYLSQELKEGVIISKDEENANVWLKEAYKRGYKN